LENNGHSPSKRLSGGKLSYVCPFQWHSETNPSFIVWTDDAYESFYCFGCQSGANIINLVSLYEGISKREAVKKLGEGLDFTISDEEKINNKIISQSESSIMSRASDPVVLLSQKLTDISYECSNYLKSVDYDEQELNRIDKIWEILDRFLKEYDLEKIDDIHGRICLFLKQQLKIYTNKQK